MDYNKTLNLPKTEFPMRASLPQREPEFLKGWEKRKLYNQLMEHNEGKPLFVLHDGPPYANGSIHIGHALNKTLKDFIVRYKNMTGFKSPYVPGWDTHGLPTEKKQASPQSQISQIWNFAKSAATQRSVLLISKERALKGSALWQSGIILISHSKRNLSRSKSKFLHKWLQRAISIKD